MPRIEMVSKFSSEGDTVTEGVVVISDDEPPKAFGFVELTAEQNAALTDAYREATEDARPRR